MSKKRRNQNQNVETVDAEILDKEGKEMKSNVNVTVGKKEGFFKRMWNKTPLGVKIGIGAVGIAALGGGIGYAVGDHHGKKVTNTTPAEKPNLIVDDGFETEDEALDYYEKQDQEAEAENEENESEDEEPHQETEEVPFG